MDDGRKLVNFYVLQSRHNLNKKDENLFYRNKVTILVCDNFLCLSVPICLAH